MKNISELELPEIDISDPAYSADPHGYLAPMREQSWIAKYPFGYMLLDHESMKFFLQADNECRMPHRDIVQSWGAVESVYGDWFSNVFMALPNEDHARIRRIIAPAFTPKAADPQRPLIREVVNAMIDKVASRGGCDFMTEIAAKIPITVFCRMIGIQVEDIDDFEKWISGLEAGFAQDSAALAGLDDSIKNMLVYVREIVRERRAPGDHPDDFIQMLCDLADDGDRLTDKELENLIVFLLGGAYDTTRNSLANLIQLLADRPEEWDLLAADESRAKLLIEEMLRYRNPIGGSHRVTNEEMTYRDVVIPANTFISIPVTVSGRDPSAFDDPDTFDPDRPKPAPHLAFGQGRHICPGMFFARAILEEALPIVARRLKNLKVSGAYSYGSPLGMWGLTTLPVSFDPEVALVAD